MSKLLVKTLYRSLLKLSRTFDSNPALSTLLYRKVIITKFHSAAELYHSQILNQIFKNNTHYLLPVTDSLSSNEQTLRQVVRNAFREKSDISLQDRVDVAFKVISKFSSVYHHSKCIEAKNSDDGKQQQEPTTALQVQPQSKFESGTILLAHPLTEGPFKRAVVLLLQHEESKGSYGLIINRSKPDILSTVVDGLSDRVQNTFGHLNVNFGGMVRRFNCIHDFQDCDGMEIPNCSEKNKLYAGFDFEKLVSRCEQLSKDGNDLSQHLSLFVGCCQWDVEQLADECARGYWIPVKAQPDKILELMKQWSNNDVSSSNNNNSDNNNKKSNKETLEDVSDMDSVTSVDGDKEKREALRSLYNTNAVKVWKHLLASMTEPRYHYVSQVSPLIDVTTVPSVDF